MRKQKIPQPLQCNIPRLNRKAEIVQDNHDKRRGDPKDRTRRTVRKRIAMTGSARRTLFPDSLANLSDEELVDLVDFILSFLSSLPPETLRNLLGIDNPSELEIQKPHFVPYLL